MLVKSTPGVNLINILRVTREFLVLKPFLAAFHQLHESRKKLCEALSNKKFACKMLMKLMAGVNFTNILAQSANGPASHYFEPKVIVLCHSVLPTKLCSTLLSTTKRLIPCDLKCMPVVLNLFQLVANFASKIIWWHTPVSNQTKIMKIVLFYNFT